MTKFLRDLDDRALIGLAALVVHVACAIVVIGMAVVFVGWVARMAWGWA